MDKEVLINLLYYLWDKIDPAFMNEVNKVMKKYIEIIENTERQHWD